MDLVYKVEKILQKENLVKKGDCVLVGVSGGIDSTTLLHILAKIRIGIQFDLGICHVNHLLRGKESERDEEFVKDLGKKLGFPVFVKRVDTKSYANLHKLSIQHAARDLRYKFLEEVAEREGYERIAIAHTLDDQVETFLLRIIKGTGIKGLSCIPMRNGKIIRPLLFVKRREIEAYAEKNRINHVEDSSNVKLVYQRNFVRHRIVPLLEELNPRFKEKVISLLEDLTLINGIFEKNAGEFLSRNVKIKEGDTFLNVEDILKVDKETRFRILSYILSRKEEGFILTRQKMRIIEKMAESTKPNLSHRLKGDLFVKRMYDKIVFTKKRSERYPEKTFSLRLGQNIIEELGIEIFLEIIDEKPPSFPEQRNIAFLDAEKIEELMLRTFREGDRFFPLGMSQKVKLKDFFISLKIPKEKRRKIPLLISGSDIIWIVGIRIDERYKVREDTKKVLKVFVEDLAKRN